MYRCLLTFLIMSVSENNPGAITLVSALLLPLSCATAFVGTAVISPLLVKPFSLAWNKLLRPCVALVLHLATGNLWREPRRVSAATNALMIGVTLIVLVTALVGSVQASIKGFIDHMQPADWTLLLDSGFSQDASFIEVDADQEQQSEIKETDFSTIDVVKELKQRKEITNINPVRLAGPVTVSADSLPEIGFLNTLNVAHHGCTNSKKGF